MRELALGEALEVLIDHRGKTPKKLGGDFAGTGVPVASAMLVKDGRLSLAEARLVSEEMYRRWMPVPTKRHDVVLTSEAPLGRVALVPDDNPLVLGQRLFGLRGRKGVLDSRFLFYALQTEAVQSELQGRATGTTVTGIRQSELVRVRIPAPNFEQQKAIATVLGALDDKIAVNERVASSALELASACYLQDSTSPQWHDVPLAEAAIWQSGGTPRTSEPSFWGGRIPWISAASLKSPWIADSDRRVTELGLQNGTRLVPKGTVIFVVRGMSLKTEFRIGLTQCEVAFGQDCKALLPKNGVGSDLLFHAIRARTDEILNLVDEAGHGTGRLATDRLERMKVCVPVDPVDPVGTKLRSLDCLAGQREQESSRLAELRDTLLPGLMSGAIRVRDAEKAVEDGT